MRLGTPPFSRLLVGLLTGLLVSQPPRLALAQEETALSVQKVVQQVLTVHPLTAAMQARVRIALDLVRQAGAYANPTFTFEDNDPSREHTYGLNQTLEWPFKRAYRIDVAKADEQIAEEERGGIHQDLIAIAREAFFRVLLAQEGSRTAGAFAAATVQVRQSTEKLFREGDVPEFDVTKANVEALRAVTEVEKAQGQRMTAEAGLKLLLGRETDRPLSLEGSLATTPPVLPLVDLFVRAEEQNPQLAVQKQTVRREKINLKLAWAFLVPDPTITIAKRDNLSMGVTGPIVGFSFSLPLWDRKEGAIAAASSKITAAEATLRATRLQLHQALLVAYRAWESANGQVGVFVKGLIVQAEAAAALAERRYHEGEGDLLGVLDAQRSLFTVRRDYAQALFEQQMAWVATEHVAGIATEQ